MGAFFLLRTQSSQRLTQTWMLVDDEMQRNLNNIPTGSHMPTFSSYPPPSLFPLHRGCRYGRPVTWNTGFPFTVVSHPQYTGAAMTAWGVCVLLADPIAVDRGWFALAIVQTLYYVYMSVVEATCGAVW